MTHVDSIVIHVDDTVDITVLTSDGAFDPEYNEVFNTLWEQEYDIPGGPTALPAAADYGTWDTAEDFCSKSEDFRRHLKLGECFAVLRKFYP
jgi:hypothetical protein